MAIFHLSVKIISRSKGQSAIASVAYRSGQRLVDQETGQIKDFTHKRGVQYSEIQLPDQAPRAYNDREVLWNAVQVKESKSNAQLAREVEVALPVELTRDQQIQLVHDYVQQNFVDQGMCADWSLHDKADGNPHVHIMLTMRSIKTTGDWAPKQKSRYLLDEKGHKIPQIDPKTHEQKIGARGRKMWKRTTQTYNDWNNRDKVENWRETWAEACNEYLAPALQLDHRSYQRQAKEQIPTIHEGPVARQMGDRSDRVQINQAIKTQNSLLRQLEQEWEQLKQQLERLKAALIDLQERLLRAEKKQALVQDKSTETQKLEIKGSETTYDSHKLYELMQEKLKEAKQAKQVREEQEKHERTKVNRYDPGINRERGPQR
ncbi:MobQ family relaxase [Levilactobacillus brevis]|uniref:MobQ family relaxase n=1 Tax=Levilactobacillus brevis TaxID=1580 RepID=UPI0021A27E09|nr:MobQ family relaxase [Levilactobacillus brevis]